MHAKINKQQYKHHFLKLEFYPILGIEQDNVRIINDELDPILIPCSAVEMIADPTQNLLFEPISIFEKPYFWCILHEGDAEYSLQYADLYMAYLKQKLKINVTQILYQHYQRVLQGELGVICYWQKQWLKHVFNIEKAVQLRTFQYCDWEKYMNQHLSKIKLDE